MSQQDTDGESPQVDTVRMDRGPNVAGMTAEWLPDPDDILAKTDIDKHDPARVAVSRQFGTIWPEIAHLQDTIDEFVDDFLKGKTSVDGKARGGFEDILMTAHGGGPRSVEERRSMIYDGLAADLYDDD